MIVIDCKICVVYVSIFTKKILSCAANHDDFNLMLMLTHDDVSLYDGNDLMPGWH